MKAILLALGTAVSLVTSGCFIGMPSRGTPELRKHLGETHTLAQDGVLVTYFGDLLLWPADEASRIGPNQKLKGRIEKGERFAVKRIRKYRMPAGISYSYRCSLLDSKQEFDLSMEFAKRLAPELYKKEK